MPYHTARLELTADEIELLQAAVRLSNTQLIRDASLLNRDHRIADINVLLIKLDCAKREAR